VKKFNIKEIDNGFILTWLDCGLSSLKEPYNGCKPILVFTSLEELLKYIKKEFE